jgi:hypothetical protein
MIKHSLYAVPLVGSLVVARGLYADTVDDLSEQLVKMMERIGQDVDTNKPDCDNIGTALAAHSDEDATLATKLKAEESKKTKEQKADDKKKYKEKYGDRLTAAKSKIAPIEACKTNAKVKAYKRKVMGLF